MVLLARLRRTMGLSHFQVMGEARSMRAVQDHRAAASNSLRSASIGCVPVSSRQAGEGGR